MALLDIGNYQAALQKCFVRQDYRGKDIGVGQQLLNNLLKGARHQLIEEIHLGTTEVYKAGHRFYEKNNFVEITKTELPQNFLDSKLTQNFINTSYESLFFAVERTIRLSRLVQSPRIADYNIGNQCQTIFTIFSLQINQ